MKNNFWEAVIQNATFVLEFLAIVAVMFVIAYAAEKMAKKRNGDKERILTTRKIAMIGMFAAIAAVLHIMDFAIPFMAPPFYKLDFSELPALIGSFAFGPVAGVMKKKKKIILKLVFKGTSTAFVGDLANFVIVFRVTIPFDSAIDILFTFISTIHYNPNFLNFTQVVEQKFYTNQNSLKY